MVYLSVVTDRSESIIAAQGRARHVFHSLHFGFRRVAHA